MDTETEFMKPYRFSLRILVRLKLGLIYLFLVSVAPAQTPDPALGQTAGASSASDAEEINFLSFPRFKIPFNVQSANADLSEVQLWVSTDEGQSWQMHGAKDPSGGQFDFRAAAEGMYWFSVRTVDSRGASFPSRNPPLKVLVDTTKPKAEMRGDLNSSGQLVVDIRVADENLMEDTAVLRMRTDRDPEWEEVALQSLQSVENMFEMQVVLDLPPCREVGLVLAIYDKASNVGEASFQFIMPRTAAGDQEMTLASNAQSNVKRIEIANPEVVRWKDGRRGPDIPNAVSWSPAADQPTDSAIANSASPRSMNSIVELSGPASQAGSIPDPAVADNRKQEAESQVNSSLPSSSPGKLAATIRELELGPSIGLGDTIQVEELPLPVPLNASDIDNENGDPSTMPPNSGRSAGSLPVATELLSLDEPSNQGGAASDPGASSARNAFHCRSRAFSLDYSVDALGGTTLSEVELWGTEDEGQSWQRWGADPDRQSPFDVRVGNDGLFGFRMVIVGGNGVVSNRPKNGDSADAWINVDTQLPTVKITRAVYGEGPEEGRLVISYECSDSFLVERPITLSYSERIEGPATIIASGLKNSGLYVWQPDPNLPQQIYLRLEAVDKAGNVGLHRLDAPIDTQGLAPRGRIQGFRPILSPNP